MSLVGLRLCMPKVTQFLKTYLKTIKTLSRRNPEKQSKKQSPLKSTKRNNRKNKGTFSDNRTRICDDRSAPERKPDERTQISSHHIIK